MARLISGKREKIRMFVRSFFPRSIVGCAARRHVLLLLSFLMLAGCQDGSLFSPNTHATSRLQLRPFFAVNGSAAVDVNRIRVTVTRLPENEVVDVQTIDVDPTAAQWNLDLDVPANSELRILLELMNGAEVVYSGIVDVTVTSGEQTSPPPVPVFPGPPENLGVTGIVIAPRDPTVAEGREIPLSANVVGGPGPNATVTWVSLNSSVATVIGSGRNAQVTGHTPGEAIITALAGPASDRITVRVVARAASVQVTPSETTVASLNSNVTFAARVLDARGAELPDATITWSIADPAIATQVAPGVFKALQNGTTTVTATAVQNGETLTGTATLRVDQHATSLEISPAEKRFTAFGQTQVFTATAHDAGGNPIPSCACWTSSNPDVATVDADGLVTARANGSAVISITLGGLTAEANVTVGQEAARITLDPTEATLVSVNETVQLTAEVEDAQGNQIDLPVTWTSTVPGVATVDDNGLVTARGDGITIVSATSGTRRANATIRVERVAAGVLLDQEELEMDAGTTFQLGGSVVDANGFSIGALELSWSSDDTGVATVNPTTGLIAAVSEGTATITAAYNGFSASATVIVTGTGGGGGGGSNDGGDVVVFNDINVWDDAAFSRDTNNELFFRNLFGNITTGARAGAKKIWFDHGRNSNCSGPCVTLNGLTTALALDDLVIQYIATTSGTLIDIPSDVRAIILWNPNVPYTTAELNSLKLFASQGGRIIFVGEHGSFYSGFALENSFLQIMGSPMRVVPSFVDCGYVDLPASSIKPHPITAGVTSLTMGCSSVLELGEGDLPLYVDDGLGSDSYDGIPCNATCVLAAVTKIDTTPIVEGQVATGQRAMRTRTPTGVPPIPNPKSSTGY